MSLYPKILVTIDCSPVDDAVLQHIVPLAIQNGSQVFLLHVVHSHTLDEDRDLTADAKKTLDKYRQQLSDQGIKAEVILRSGEPAPEICAEILKQDFSLVAMATHGHSLLESLLYGSVSRTLKQQVNIPILLIPADK